MAQRPGTNTQKFSSRFGFIIATAGGAVGLGNIWSFTYVAGKNGGGGFMLVYLLALAFIAAPVFIAELLLGRMGGNDPVSSLKRLQRSVGSRLPWQWVAWAGLAGTVLILSFYSVIAGQIMAYGFEALRGGFAGWSNEQVREYDAAFKAHAIMPMFWTAVFCAATAFIVGFDVKTGIERASKLMMPALFLILIGLVIYAAFTGEFARAVDFLFGFNDQTFTSGLFLDAVGQAFFTISVGVCAVMVMGAYMGEEIDLPRASLWIILMDLAVALMAGLAIFPLLFAGGVEPGVGPGLIFVTLPLVFTDIPAGALVAFVFFLLLTFAALTSSIILMAPTTAKLQQRGVSRPVAATLVALLVFTLSILTIKSFAEWREFYPLAAIGLDGLTWFQLIKDGVNNIFLPMAGLAFVLMVGWALPRDRIQASLPMHNGALFTIWYFAVRYVVPVAVVALLVSAILG
ncbi:sodium-dependent transporter [Kordiimonas aquimaris]|uniref:sodium-dependent transporter n=1 Tax=Kordiimonas aquimaris TaxID=707591 RepID=UPI0021D194BB|nr:sodium-dependent transporter [Kordiimonas aquimaris]